MVALLLHHRLDRSEPRNAVMHSYYGNGIEWDSLVLSTISASTWDGGTFYPWMNIAVCPFPTTYFIFYFHYLVVEPLRQIFSFHFISMNNSASMVSVVCWDMTRSVNKWDLERNVSKTPGNPRYMESLHTVKWSRLTKVVFIRALESFFYSPIVTDYHHQQCSLYFSASLPCSWVLETDEEQMGRLPPTASPRLLLPLFLTLT